MAKERLSELQKFILSEGYERGIIVRDDFKKYYGLDKPVWTSEGWRKGLGNSKRVTIFKCLKNLIDKGLVEKINNDVILTEKGVDVLKVNGLLHVKNNISHKDYMERLNKFLADRKDFWETIRALAKSRKGKKRKRQSKAKA